MYLHFHIITGINICIYSSSTLSATESLPEHSYCSNAGKRKLETSPTDPLDLKQSLEKRQRALQLDHSYWYVLLRMCTSMMI